MTVGSRPLQGTIFPPNRNEARQKLNELTADRKVHVHVHALKNRVPYLFKMVVGRPQRADAYPRFQRPK